MSEPTQQDRERVVRNVCRHLGEGACIWPQCKGGATACERFVDGVVSGRRAALLELAEWLEISRGGLDPLPEPRAYYEGQRDVLGNVASRARAMVSEQPRTPSRMDDPDE